MGKSLDSQLRGYKNNPDSMVKDPTFPIFEAGVNYGVGETRKEVLSYLEKKYIEDEDRPDRKSPEAKALLAVARDLSTWLRYKIDGQ